MAGRKWQMWGLNAGRALELIALPRCPLPCCLILRECDRVWGVQASTTAITLSPEQLGSHFKILIG